MSQFMYGKENIASLNICQTFYKEQKEYLPPALYKRFERELVTEVRSNQQDVALSTEWGALYDREDAAHPLRNVTVGTMPEFGARGLNV